MANSSPDTAGCLFLSFGTRAISAHRSIPPLGCLWSALGLALCLWLGVAEPASAQTMGVPQPQSAPAAATPPSDAEALEALIRSLEDPSERADLLAKLRALRAIEAGDAPPRAEADPAMPDLVAATVIDEFADELRRRTDTLFDIATDIADSTDQLPALVSWIYEQAADDEYRRIWIFVTGAVFGIVALGLLARYLVLRARPPLDPERPRTCMLRRFAVELLGAFVFGALTPGVLTLANGLVSTSVVEFSGLPDIDLTVVATAAMSLTAFFFIAMLWRAVIRLMFGEPGIVVPLVPVTERTARTLRAGLFKIGRLGFVGFGVLFAFFQLGMPESLFLFLVHLLFLAVAGIAILLVLRLRDTVAIAIRTWNDESGAALARFVPGYFLARTWHYFAILLILLHYLVWALKVPGGILFLSRATLLTLIVLIIARSAVLAIDRYFEGGVPLTAESEDLLPGVQERANRYAGPARLLMRGAITLVAVIAILTAWNTGVLEWLRSDIGRAFVGLVFRLAIIVALTVLAFEVTSLLAGRFIGAKNEHGKPLHSNRARTLTGILANVGYFIFGMVGIFSALSHLGVETAPLLAGAGVVGLAIGFGSQALVKDLITGLFILLGDTIRVGDVIDTAAKSGVVEEMSMRTITLRSYDGNVHTIPYGSIDVVTNMTKEYSFALMDIEIAYKENTDDVIRVIREIDDRLRKEWPYRRLILEPIDIAGVDQFGNSAVAIRMRSKTRPGEQWGIRREFLRRIKLRFDELGIEIPYPHQTVYFGADKAGHAAPLLIKTLDGARPDLDAGAEPEHDAPDQATPKLAAQPAAAASQRRVGSD